VCTTMLQPGDGYARSPRSGLNSLIVVMLMVVLPILSILSELLIFPTSTEFMPLVGKWFVFWAMGIRLFLTGLHQAIAPQFIVKQRFAIKTKEPPIIVKESEFATLAIGCLGIIALFSQAWIMPAAMTGGLFYALEGIRYLEQNERDPQNNMKMLADLFTFIVLLAYFSWAIPNINYFTLHFA
jgi:hypothetical protein